MKKGTGSLTVISTLLFLCSPASAHHGNSAYDETARVPIKGVITEFVWTNPHSQIYLDVKDSNGDRKSTRLNSSHRTISYAVFCLKKKKKKNIQTRITQLLYLAKVHFIVLLIYVLIEQLQLQLMHLPILQLVLTPRACCRSVAHAK